MIQTTQTRSIPCLGSALALAALVLPGAAGARDQIRIVGSSTVARFATVVAEEFGRSSDFETPIVENTGTGEGLELFCSGVGVAHPDITNASRRIEQSEVDRCAVNGVREITEIKIGYDGIVIANSKKAAKPALTLRQIFLALAEQVPAPNGEWVPNPNQTWKDVDPSLPDVGIEVLGPSPTSGTRVAFNELALEGGCKTFPEIEALKSSDPARYESICHSVREDGNYVEAGDTDDLSVRRLVAHPDALGVFGFSFLDQNADRIQGGSVEGLDPTFENIAGGSYPVSRSLYFYVKKAHVGKTPGMQEYIAEFTSEKACGDFGYLTDKGLIPAPKEEREKYRAAGENLTALELAASQ